MKKIFIMAAAVMFLAACQKELGADGSKKNQNKEEQSDDNKQKEKPNKTFTIKGSLSGTSILIPSLGCGAAGFLNVGHGSGTSSHFGAFIFDNADCLGALHHTVFTYPNGDKTFTTETAEFIDPLTGALVQDAVFSGGTGRFEGASGTTRLYITKFEPGSSPGVYNIAGVFEGTVTLTRD